MNYPYRKEFYSEELQLTLHFHENGTLGGELTYSELKQNRVCELSGIYLEEDKKIALAFFTPPTNILNSFYGEIIRHFDNLELLMLKFWDEENPSCTEIKQLLLFDTPGKISDSPKTTSDMAKNLFTMLSALI